ncbi:hypothetical protein X763_19170 [Mesorhizobium sp. LSHC432A00]|nr:hypothetical protein X766_23360 [Mesorhizobium sp. LSJC255A00]ESX35547.1 hypothetical protein X763_19170 [Mesorhizobium sp. LSHC432A00]ESX41963.1 hypothetical protein X764_15460 [Mesorhizobium sp. LSHC440A00]ESX76082.1 hypothetical protein X757_16800 [Mesorhizobium sp. LSHC414A00]
MPATIEASTLGTGGILAMVATSLSRKKGSIVPSD